VGIEIERRFLLASEAWRPLVVRRSEIAQGYLAKTGKATVRARIRDDLAWVCIKSAKVGRACQEFEYAISTADAVSLLELTQDSLIRKVRYEVLYAGHTWEIDEFHGNNKGLIVAEIELDQADEQFDRPNWLGLEVTEDPKYFNSSLSTRPFTTWSPEEQGAVALRR
jgi:adenylate cyclase